MSSDKDTPLYNAHKEVKSFDSQGHHTWCRNIKNILSEYGYQSLWDNQDAIREHNMDSEVIQTLTKHIYEKYRTDWLSEVRDTTMYPKLRCYRIFKHSHGKEPYITVIKNKSQLRCLSQFRVSSHRLAIEVGRYTQIPAAERLCKYCSLGSIDDEIHLVTKCTHHINERTQLYHCANKNIQNFTLELPDMEIFTLIMESNSKHVIRALGQFLQLCYKKRLP